MIAPSSLGELVAARATAEPERAVIRLEDGPLTYGALDNAADRVARSLLERELAKGDRVAVMLPTSRDYLATWIGSARAGLVEVPLNTAYRGDLLGAMVAGSGSRLLVTDASLLDRFLPLLPELTDLRHVVVVGAGDGDSARDAVTEASPHLGYSAFEELLAIDAGPKRRVDVNGSDVSTILYTSGTTGPSKGVVLSHLANFTLAVNVNRIMDYGPSDVLYNAFPLFHVNARYTGVLCAMLANAEIVLRSRFSASGFWETCRAESVTAFNFMGAMLVMLFKQAEQPGDSDNPVTRAYGAPAPVDILEAFERRFGVHLVEVYGSTEAGTVTVNSVAERRVGSCGRPSPYYDVAVLDPDGRTLPPGSTGEIAVRPKEPHVLFERYHNLPEATLEAFSGLWFHTGDRGRFDDDGWLTYVDRVKDSIRRRGENISSYEVEQAVLRLPEVAEAAAVGVPSELTEEEVLVVLVPTPGSTIVPENVIGACELALPSYAVPRYVRVVDELPKTPSQRTEKFRLRAEGIPAGTWDRQSVAGETPAAPGREGGAR